MTSQQQKSLWLRPTEWQPWLEYNIKKWGRAAVLLIVQTGLTSIWSYLFTGKEKRKG